MQPTPSRPAPPLPGPPSSVPSLVLGCSDPRTAECSSCLGLELRGVPFQSGYLKMSRPTYRLLTRHLQLSHPAQFGRFEATRFGAQLGHPLLYVTSLHHAGSQMLVAVLGPSTWVKREEWGVCVWRLRLVRGGGVYVLHAGPLGPRPWTSKPTTSVSTR